MNMRAVNKEENENLTAFKSSVKNIANRKPDSVRGE